MPLDAGPAPSAAPLPPAALSACPASERTLERRNADRALDRAEQGMARLSALRANREADTAANALSLKAAIVELMGALVAANQDLRDRGDLG